MTWLRRTLSCWCRSPRLILWADRRLKCDGKELADVSVGVLIGAALQVTVSDAEEDGQAEPLEQGLVQDQRQKEGERASRSAHCKLRNAVALKLWMALTGCLRILVHWRFPHSGAPWWTSLPRRLAASKAEEPTTAGCWHHCMSTFKVARAVALTPQRMGSDNARLPENMRSSWPTVPRCGLAIPEASVSWRSTLALATSS